MTDNVVHVVPVLPVAHGQTKLGSDRCAVQDTKYTRTSTGLHPQTRRSTERHKWIEDEITALA